MLARTGYPDHHRERQWYGPLPLSPEFNHSAPGCWLATHGRTLPHSWTLTRALPHPCRTAVTQKWRAIGHASSLAVMGLLIGSLVIYTAHQGKKRVGGCW